MSDCIQPIMLGTPQRMQPTKALPQIDPQIVAACKERDPNFGKRRQGEDVTVGHVVVLGGDRRPSCSRKMRRGGLRRTLRSCRYSCENKKGPDA
jgi:hypothetical protein